MIRNIHDLFNGPSFYEFSRDAEENLPVGLKILETQGLISSGQEEKIHNWVNCYGLKTDNFPFIDETNTLVTPDQDADISYIVYHLPFYGDQKFLYIRPTVNAHHLQCTIDELNKNLLIYFPIPENLPESIQKAEISDRYKAFVADLKESLLALRNDFDIFNDKVEAAIRAQVDDMTRKAGNSDMLVKELQSEISHI